MNSTFSGAGNILAFDLISETTIISLSGTGKAEVYVDQLLDVTITGAGSVYYKGKPTIIQNITGSGSLIDAGLIALKVYHQPYPSSNSLRL